MKQHGVRTSLLTRRAVARILGCSAAAWVIVAWVDYGMNWRWQVTLRPGEEAVAAAPLISSVTQARVRASRLRWCFTAAGTACLVCGFYCRRDALRAALVLSLGLLMLPLYCSHYSHLRTARDAIVSLGLREAVAPSQATGE